MGKARAKLSGTALAEFNAKHPRGAGGRFVKAGSAGAGVPSVPSTPTPGRARARLGLASKVDMPSAMEQLRAKRANPVSGDREAVDAILKPMTDAQLMQVARANGFDSFIRGNKTQKRQQLVESLVGGRLDHDAIMRIDLSFKPTRSGFDEPLPQPRPRDPQWMWDLYDAQQAKLTPSTGGTSGLERLMGGRPQPGEFGGSAKAGRAREALSPRERRREARAEREADKVLAAEKDAERISGLGSEQEIIDALAGKNEAELRLIGEEIFVRVHRDMRDPEKIKAHIARSVATGLSNISFRPSKTDAPAPAKPGRARKALSGGGQRATQPTAAGAHPSRTEQLNAISGGRNIWEQLRQAHENDVTASSVQSRLQAATSVEEARAFLDGIPAADLRRIAGELDVPGSSNKAIKDALTKIFVQGRLTTAAVRQGSAAQRLRGSGPKA